MDADRSVDPTTKPRPTTASHSITPAAASRPKADPPDSTIASTRSTRVSGARSSVSRLPGAPPRTSTEATAGCSASTTVVPVMPSRSSAWPTRMPGTSVTRLRGPVAAIMPALVWLCWGIGSLTTFWSLTVLDRILITNDDGIDAPGLEVLERIAGELAREVWIVAPEHDQSGVSHAVSLHHPIRVSERGSRRYAVSGTPGDCAVMGVCHLMVGAAPDLLLCGVNRGANLGMETVFSGTVGGAMTGMMLGVPSIALSQAWTDREQIRWPTAAALGPGVIRQLLAIGWD